MADDRDVDGEDGENAVLNNVEYELKVPVQEHGEKVTSVIVRRPKLRDMKKVSAHRGTDADRAGKMIQILTGKSDRFVDELDGVDVDGLSKVIDSFT